MLDIELGPREPIPPAFAKQVRYYDAFGEMVELIDTTAIWEARERSHGDAPAFMDRWAKANYPAEAVAYAGCCFWPCEAKWVITSRHNRVQERLAVDAAQARRFARMMQGRDRL